MGEKSSSKLQLRASQKGDELGRVTIVGGGIAGLATAAALQNIAGINSFVILEKSSKEEFEDIEAGAGAQLGPNGLRALHAIGGDTLVNQIKSIGSTLKGNAVMVPGATEPMIIPDTAEAESGLPNIFVRWGMLRQLLTGLLPNDCIHFNTGNDICGFQTIDTGRVKLLEKRGNGVTEALLLDGRVAESNLIVGADGCFSMLRYLVNNKIECIPNDLECDMARKSGIKFTGRINLKAIVHRTLGDAFLPGTTYSFFAPNANGIGCFAGPAGPNSTYWAVSIVEDNIKGSDLLSIDGTGSDDSVKEGLLSILYKLKSKECQFIIDLIDDTFSGDIYVTKSAEAIEIGPSLVLNDKIVLVGDAAHSMSGSYGQNPNFALEDAVVLAKCIKDDPSISRALISYSEVRVDRCLEMQRRSSERAAKSMKGEKSEDYSKWIFHWKP